MTQPPAEGRDPGPDPGAEPGGGVPPARDPRLAGFESGGVWDSCPPSAGLAAAAEGVSGSGWRCPGASDDELDGVLGRWAALESWAQAGKLGVVAEKVRRAQERPGALGGASSTAIESLVHEVALALAVSVRGADRAVWLAMELASRLPGIGARLRDGTLTQSKAATLAEELSVLDDAHAAAAEAFILGQLAGKTHGQLARLAARAACTIDPEGARKRREAAERDDARVRLWREQSGTAALSGTGLPPDEALAAFANVGTRAQEYKDSAGFEGARMDQLRAMAYLDLLNGMPAADRIARAIALARAEAEPRAARDPDADASPGLNADTDPGSGARGTSAPGGTGSGAQDPDPDPDPDGSDTGDDDPGLVHPRPGGSGPGSQPGGSSAAGGPDPEAERQPARQDLIIPLRTLLGLTARPGEGRNLGPLDPGLVLGLAASAALSPLSTWCITIVDADGIAIGHGCARTVRAAQGAQPHRPRAGPLAAYPARVNLTIPLSALPGLSALQSRRPADSRRRWAFTPRDDPGPPGGYGTWTLALPGGREFTVRLDPVPVFDCDHRNESHAYKPNDTLRHLVQVRDGECTFPSCSRHARETDFEHAVPYAKGGRTCACNAGARSRSCHRVKQSRGWSVIQPQPGWHRWTTPSGRTYTQGPKQYPA